MITCFAVYVADESGPCDPDEGVCSTCVALFGDAEDAIKEARAHLLEGYSVSIDIGCMTEAEWDAIDEVPDDFVFASRPTADAVREDVESPVVSSRAENSSSSRSSSAD